MGRTVLTLALLLPLVAAADSRFTSASMNFSVITPGDGWRWNLIAATEEGGGVWAVEQASCERFSISVSSRGYFRISESWIAAFRTELLRDGARHDYGVESFHCDRRDSPLRSSYTFSYVRVERGGHRSYVDGYIGATNRVYTLQYASRSRAALLEFRRLVESFRIADKLEAQRGALMEAGVTTFPGLPALGLDTSLGRPLAPNEAIAARR